MIRIDKTVYDAKEKEDGRRILVMRFWPRGVSKEKVDVWMKELGTERELIRRWKEGRVGWSEFSREYLAGLKGKEGILRSLAEESRKGTITLLCTDRDPKRCHRSILKREIEKYL